jgi:hypothetical protein
VALTGLAVASTELDCSGRRLRQSARPTDDRLVEAARPVALRVDSIRPKHAEGTTKFRRGGRAERQ